MTKSKSVKSRTPRLVVKSKTLTKPACDSQMGGAPAKTAYLMLVPADDAHSQGSKINISDGETGTIKELISVADLKEFADDNGLKGAKPTTKPGTRQVVLGKIGDSIKANNNNKAKDITFEHPIEVKYDKEIELYNPNSATSNIPSIATSENKQVGTNLFATEYESKHVAEHEHVAEPEPVAESVSETKTIPEDQLNTLRTELNQNEPKTITEGQKQIRYVLQVTKKKILVKKNDIEICSMSKPQVQTITLENLTRVYSAFSTLSSHCVFFVYKYKISDDNNKEVYIVFNKYTAPQILQIGKSAYLNSVDCNKQGEVANSYIISPTVDELNEDKYKKDGSFIADKYFNEKPIKQSGGKRTTLRRPKKMVSKPAMKTLKRY